MKLMDNSTFIEIVLYGQVELLEQVRGINNYYNYQCSMWKFLKNYFFKQLKLITIAVLGTNRFLFKKSKITDLFKLI